MHLDLVLSSIPSPGTWGRQYRLYGIMIALGVIAGLELARKRWADRGGNPEDMSSIALWAVPAGLIGARLYHVITDNQLYRDNLIGIFKIWEGGLGIPGGIVAGVGVGLWAGHRRGIRLPVGLDAVAPALPLAQAIGRWGNYFNVELFGRPTTLPWGLQVPDDIAARAGYGPGQLYHPTFLYESLWNLGLVAFLILLDRRRVIRPGRLFAVYIGGYFLGRLWVEALRSDEANKILGLRLNIWTSLVAIAGVLVYFAVTGLRRRPDDSDEPYTDGHRFDPALAYVPAPHAPDADVALDADVASEADDALVADGASYADDADDEAADGVGSSAPAGGTRARAARQRASGGDDDEKPAGGP